MIDTPPHNTAEIAAAMRVADLTVIPFRPAVFDIAAVAATLDLARAIGKTVLPVINAAPARRGANAAHVVTEARKAVLAMKATAWSGQITTRAAFAHALASGQAVGEFEPGSSAAVEMGDLWQETRRALGLKEGQVR
jgi:chromosome partitioning protein